MTTHNPPDDYLSIATPENVAFGYDIAGIGSRFLAAVVDMLILLALILLVELTLSLIAASFFRDQLLNDSPVLAWMAAIFGLIAFALFWGYYIFFEMLWNGQSPGKRWVGLRVIRTDGTPITLTESIVRNLVRLVDFLPAYYGVGVVTMFVNGQSRRLGDLAAGTLVVRDRAAVTLESLATRPAPPAPALPPAAADDAFPPGGVGNITRGEGVRRGTALAAGFKNVCYSHGFDDYSTARVRLVRERGEPVAYVLTAAA